MNVKRILCLLTAFLMLSSFLALAACGKGAKTTEEAPSSPSFPSESVQDPSVEESSASPSEEERMELPPFTTLYGTKHLPIPDHQGSIGSCTSEGVTYTQFTVAVSQFIHATDPDTDWNPSSGDNKYIFSPKYTYNFAGPSTEYCYTVLKDHGCLPMSLSSFYKSERQPSQLFQNASGLNQEKSRSWDVAKGLMEKALKYRITDFEEVEFSATHASQLTTDQRGQDLLYKIKEALARGNSVTICGWPNYLTNEKLTEEGKGSIGIAGESVAWTGMTSVSGEGSSGNHCVSIIGYDDTITVTKAGVTLKGAFQIRDSYANDNREIYYVMYDAFNLVSENEIFNDPNFYLNNTALSLEGNEFEFGHQAEHNQMLTFTPTGKTFSFKGKDFPLYTVTDEQNGCALVLNGTTFSSGHTGNAAELALIPYEDATEQPLDEDYKGGYLLAAVSGNGIKGYFGTEINANHASIRFYKTADDNMEKVCFDLSADKKEGTFLSRVCVSKSSGTGYKRTGTFYRFSFLYWDEDIQIGTPQLMVEAKVSKVGRDDLAFVLTRTDKNGSTVEYTPACTDVPLNKNFLPELNQVGDTAFSGKSEPTKAEVGYFTFGFHVLDDFGSNADYDDFIWGVRIRGGGTEILSLRLLDGNGKELCSVIPAEKDRTVQKGSPKSFEFRQSGELGTHFGKGSYTFYNVGQKKTLSLKSNNMLFEWQNEKKADSVERSVFRVEYDGESDSYIFRHGTLDYVFDIHGGELKKGAVVKMNAQSEQRPGQRWTVIRNDDGTVLIASKAEPSLYLGFDGKDFTLGSDPSNASYRFAALSTTQSDRYLDLTPTKKGFEAVARLPEGYTADRLSLEVVKDGKTVGSFQPTVKGDQLSFSSELAAGDYLVYLAENGECVGSRVAFRIG